MVSVKPNPQHISDFPNAAAFERWLKANHRKADELWLKTHKKASGLPTVTYAEALDVALCWGWIDGLKKAFDENSFLQRFTPRRPKSIWSQNNREHVDRLCAAGRIEDDFNPEGMRRQARLFAITEYLRGRRTGVTAEQIADRFGVTVRTAYRDLDARTSVLAVTRSTC